MGDRYRVLTDGLLAIFEAHTPAQTPLDTQVYQYLRAQAPKAVLRSHCDRHGHDPQLLVRAHSADGVVVIHRVGCSYCGIELKEVDE